MIKISRLLLAIIILFNIVGCQKTNIDYVSSSDTIYIRKIEDLPQNFIMGMDLSSVISLENSGVKFYNYENNKADIFETLAKSGINYIRVRVWNDPYDKDGNSYGGGNCDINNAIAIGKRATKYGMKLLVDFHYSDFWADPSKQMCPKEWKDMDIEAKGNALYEYTKDSLGKLKNENIDVGMVQIGNETNGSMAGETTWKNIIFDLMTNASKAIREVFPKAMIAVHFANPENSNSYLTYAKKLDYYNLDYDVFGSSYYPYWHGTLQNLQETLSIIASTYNKKTMVLETSYAYTNEDFDFFGNTISSESSITKDYPFSQQGQVNCLLDIIETIKNTTNGIGICYWEGAWIPVGHNSYDENFNIWQKYGSGWASKYAAEYDPNDAGKYYGGSAVDNQTLFDKYGHPLESLKVFALSRTGNIINVFPESIMDTSISCDLNGNIVLPSTVEAIMNDGSKQNVNVHWAEFNEEKMKSNGAKTYDIIGYTDDMMIAICHVSMVEYNFVNNFSFEEDDNRTNNPSSWNVINNGNINELYVEDKITDSLSGNKHFHFWASTDNTIDFDLEQNIENLQSGTYKYSISIMGGDCINQNIFMYVKINDVIVSEKPLTITTYNNWDTETIENIKYNQNDKIVIGIHIQTSGKGNGAWGKIDDALLNSVR